jgi:hypothetical protein
VNEDYKFKILQHLKEVIGMKCPILPTVEVILLHNNAHHTTAGVTAKLGAVLLEMSFPSTIQLKSSA